MPARNSTNVRSKLRPFWRLADAVTPAAAARWVERRFMTPPRFTAPERERTALRPARSFDVRFASGRLRAWEVGAGPGVLLVHGWGGRGGQLMGVAPGLVEAGYRVITYDAPAHGASSGRLASPPLFAEALTAIARQDGGVHAVVAHSMGAAAAALAIHAGLALDAAVFFAPPRNPGAFYGLFCEALQLPDSLRRRAQDRLESRIGQRFEEFDVVRYAPGFLTPLLVIHDEHDAEIGLHEGAAVAGAWPGARLVVTRGLGHRRVLRDPGALGEAVSFLQGHVSARCTCGAPPERGHRQCGQCLLEATLFSPEHRRSC